MTTLTLRNTKGGPLTFTELDANFTNLDTDKAPITNPEFTGNISWTGATYENVFTITDGTTVSINPQNGTIQLWTLGASRAAAAGSFVSGQSVTLMISDGSGYTLSWPTMTWVGGFTPILSTTGYTVVELWKVGTVLYGALVGVVA